ncbi:MAG: hypothetical protein M3O09_03900, partial [Acidobacteriota bacterium]|nr:hypothetical protein [Acidobacteriota bacterium]
MRPNRWFTKAVKTSTMRFLTVGVLALLAVFVGYQGMATPVAKAAMVSPAPAAAALDDNSVGTLLALDKAMETLAARVTP